MIRAHSWVHAFRRLLGTVVDLMAVTGARVSRPWNLQLGECFWNGPYLPTLPGLVFGSCSNGSRTLATITPVLIWYDTRGVALSVIPRTTGTQDARSTPVI